MITTHVLGDPEPLSPCARRKTPGHLLPAATGARTGAKEHGPCVRSPPRTDARILHVSYDNSVLSQTAPPGAREKRCGETMRCVVLRIAAVVEVWRTQLYRANVYSLKKHY